MAFIKHDSTDAVLRPSSVLLPGNSRPLQRKASNVITPDTIPPIVHDVLNSPGQPLDAATRDFVGPRFGHDFSNVRVHTDAKAAASARAVNALAYTVGQDVVFAAGQHSPMTSTGRKLMTHELTHVVQQSRGGITQDAEVRADRAAECVDQNLPVMATELGGAAVGLQRAPDQKQASVPPVAEDTNSLDRFSRDKDTLTASHLKKIDHVAWGIQMHLDLAPGRGQKIVLTGHTDTTANEAHNLDLGEKRAAAVKAALEKKLIAMVGEETVRKRVSIVTTSVGEAPEQLIVPTKDNVDEPRNRRVTVAYEWIQTPREPAAVPSKPALDLQPGKTHGPGTGIPGLGQGIPPTLPTRDPLDPLSDRIRDALPKVIRDQLSKDQIKKGIKKGGEEAVIKILEQLIKDDGPFNKKAIISAVRAAIRQFIFGEKWTPPTPPLYEMPPSNMPDMSKSPGEVIIPFPSIPF